MRDEDLNGKTDEVLMTLYQSGQYSAFEILYRRHSGQVHGYFRKKVSEDKAKDLTQEVFMKIHRSRHQYDGQYPFLPWLFALVRNIFIDSLKISSEKISRLSTGDLPDLASEEAFSSPHDLVPLLNQLPEAQRRSIELRYMRDWSFEQIAEDIKTSPSNVRQLISRGLKKLKISLGEE